MSTSPSIQVSFDCADPHAQADFWAAALGYEVVVNEPFIRELLDAGRISDADVITHAGTLAFRDGAAAQDPDGVRPRIYFQLVEEAKVAKNRVHLDIHTGDDQAATVNRLTGLGASVLWEGQQGDHSWVTMADPEGNEFCVA